MNIFTTFNKTKINHMVDTLTLRDVSEHEDIGEEGHQNAHLNLRLEPSDRFLST